MSEIDAVKSELFDEPDIIIITLIWGSFFQASGQLIYSTKLCSETVSLAFGSMSWKLFSRFDKLKRSNIGIGTWSFNVLNNSMNVCLTYRLNGQ